MLAAQLEVAVLDRKRAQRKFKRLAGAALTSLLPDLSTPASAPAAVVETSSTDGSDGASNGGSTDDAGDSTAT
jgi:hypothetical protein